MALDRGAAPDPGARARSGQTSFGRRQLSWPVAIWEAELLPLLRESPHLSAVTLLDELQCRHPGEYGLSAEEKIRPQAARSVRFTA